jgi:hypothetical protein
MEVLSIMKKSQFLAAVIALAFGVAVLANGPVSHGSSPFPDDSAGGNIVAHGSSPFPDDSAGGNIVAHGSSPFPDDSAGGNIVA